MELLNIITSSPNNTLNCYNSKGIKLLSWLRLGLSHLGERTFKHSFQDFLNPFGSCEKGEVNTSSYYLLHCYNCSGKQLALLNTIKILTWPYYNNMIRKLLAFYFSATLLSKNTFILDATVDYIISTERFDEQSKTNNEYLMSLLLNWKHSVY